MTSSPYVAHREFLMTTQNFSDISRYAHQYTGIVLGDHKRDMVYGRLARRIRSLNLADFTDYCALISQPESSEVSAFINAITTNLTSFFREKHHFNYLKNKILTDIIRNKKNKKIRIWSAGCSTGEEPYSISIVLNNVDELEGWDCRILATDLDSNVLQQGFEGIYDSQKVGELPENIKNKYFEQDKKSSDRLATTSQLKSLITFKQLNLLELWPMKGSFDVIFCRNVVIYFNKETQKMLFERFADILVPGGHLFIGHSESLHAVTDRFKLIGQTIYQRV